MFEYEANYKCELERMKGKKRRFRDLKKNVRSKKSRFRDPRKMAISKVPSEIPFQMLTALPLSAKQWATIGRKAGWQMLRMNLNTFARHGAFDVKGFTEDVVARLVNEAEIARARVFPYQLMVAYAMAWNVPMKVRNALQDAMEIAIANVPKIDGRVVVCPDVSGSMHSPVTGYRQGATSAVRCIDVSALVAAAFMRMNEDTLVLPFGERVVKRRLNPRDTVMTNATTLASVYGGGTDCSAPIRELIEKQKKADLVVIVSDNESWINARGYGRKTGLLEAWDKYKALHRKAKLVCIDIQPYTTTQAIDRSDILNVGGFSDAVFEVIANFAKGRISSEHWVGEIEKITL
jgi:60 kDa SS-A/Ro ribonucleoprotein